MYEMFEREGNMIMINISLQSLLPLCSELYLIGQTYMSHTHIYLGVANAIKPHPNKGMII